MIEWIAADRDEGVSLSDYFVLVPAVALITVAIFNSWVSFRTARKTPHERLASLVAALKDWPDELEGVRTVHESIELALAQIRRVDQLDIRAALADIEARANARASDIERSEQWKYIGRSAMYVLAMFGFYWTAGRTANDRANAALLAFIGCAGLYLVWLIFKLMYDIGKADEFPWQRPKPPGSGAG